MKYFCTLITLHLLLFTPGCTGKNDLSSHDFEKSFEKLYLAGFGKDYPPNSEVLKTCKQNNIEECLRAYNQVFDAGQYIVSQVKQHPDTTLETVFKSISDNCSAVAIKNDPRNEMLCYGAMISWYYFDGTKQDEAIRKFVVKLPEETKRMIFSSRFEWYHNRPDAHTWVAIVNELQSTTLSESTKKQVVNYFSDSRNLVPKFGVMLLE